MRALIEYLPEHIAADKEQRAIQDALTAVMEREWAANEDLRAQIFPQTATWTLKYWESFFGIRTDESLSQDTRRAVLIAKIRSARTATVAAIAALVASFTDGGITVTEVNPKSRFVVTIEELDVTADWTGALRAALENFAPAHLAFDIERIVAGGAATEYACAACTGWCFEDTAATL